VTVTDSGCTDLSDGGVLDSVDDIRLSPDELRSWAWCTTDEAEQRLSEPLDRRVRPYLFAVERTRV
jgi:hypothetical protein